MLQEFLVKWPAIVCLHGDPELLAVGSHQQLNGMPELEAMVFSPDDRLIDSGGRVFQLIIDGGGVIQIVPSDTVLSKDGVVELLRQHYMTQGHCCVAKMSFGNASEAIRALLQDTRSA